MVSGLNAVNIEEKVALRQEVKMAEFKEVFNIRDIKDGAMKEISVDGRDILLARVGNTYYAADNRCPHMGGNLSEGKLEKTIITCPRHHSQFDLTDGHVVRWTD